MSHNRMANTKPRIFFNTSAREWKCSLNVDAEVKTFHHDTMSIKATPLIEQEILAKELGVTHLFIKDESQRAKLPAFKILGASWATYKALIDAGRLPGDTSLEDLSNAVKQRNVKLFAATDGNHGRAVARMAKILEVKSETLVPSYLDELTRARIASEGTKVTIVDGDYDYTAKEAERLSDASNGLLVQDTAWDGYTEIPQV